MIKQYWVMCDNNDQMFVVQGENQNKPNIEFKMHGSGLHCFALCDKDFVFDNTLSGTKEGVSQR